MEAVPKVVPPCPTAKELTANKTIPYWKGKIYISPVKAEFRVIRRSALDVVDVQVKWKDYATMKDAWRAAIALIDSDPRE